MMAHLLYVAAFVLAFVESERPGWPTCAPSDVGLGLHPGIAIHLVERYCHRIQVGRASGGRAGGREHFGVSE